MNRFVVTLSLSALTALVCSCSPNPRNPGSPTATEMNSMLNSAIKGNQAIAQNKGSVMPLQVRHALIPGFSLQKEKVSINDTKHFDVVVHDVPANAFFLGLVKDTPYNIVVSPKVTGTISLNLKNVTVQQVLDAVHDLYGYQYTFTPYSIQVYPSGLQTRIFKVNYLDISRAGSSSTQIASGDIEAEDQENSDEKDKSIVESSSGQKTLGGLHQNSSLSNRPGAESLTPDREASDVQTHVQTDFWRTLSRTLEVIIGNEKNHSVVINPSAGIVIVKGTPGEIQEVATYLDSLQSAMTREVIIDAKVLEITLNKGYQAGINWNIFGATANLTGANFGSGSSLGAFTKAFSINTGPKNFRATINLLSTQGNVQVLSSPRISTLNNQKAIIKVGTEQFYVTNVSNSTLATTTAETTQNVDFSPFFSGIALGVTPEIGANGDITIHVHPLISTVTQAQTQFTIGTKTTTLEMAKSAIRESDNIVTAKSGQIVVLGGLMENKTDEQLGGVPFASKIPFLGSLFRRTYQSSVKTELVILLKPTIVSNGTMVTELKNLKSETLKNEKGYHFGAFPGRFGNLAETNYFEQFKGKGGES